MRVRDDVVPKGAQPLTRSVITARNILRQDQNVCPEVETLDTTEVHHAIVHESIQTIRGGLISVEELLGVLGRVIKSFLGCKTVVLFQSFDVPGGRCVEATSRYVKVTSTSRLRHNTPSLRQDTPR